MAVAQGEFGRDQIDRVFRLTQRRKTREVIFGAGTLARTEPKFQIDVNEFDEQPDRVGRVRREILADVRAPVLIIQGRNDTRTPARPVERYVERLGPVFERLAKLG